MRRRDPAGKDSSQYLNWPSVRGKMQSAQNSRKLKEQVARLSPPRSPRGMSPEDHESRIRTELQYTRERLSQNKTSIGKGNA